MTSLGEWKVNPGLLEMSVLSMGKSEESEKSRHKYPS